MNVLSYSPADDTGGVGWFMASAFRDDPRVNYRQVTGSPSYLQYPSQNAWHTFTVLDMWQRADVVHLHDGFWGVNDMAFAPKPLVVTWHGTGFREHYPANVREQKDYGAVGLVATLDLWLKAMDDVTWCPAPLPLDELAALAAPLPGEPGVDRPLRVGHNPTNRALKSTPAFLAACERIGSDIEPVLVERQPWSVSLAVKATCDAYFDQTMFGYGQNSIEAWAMGLPVVCGGEPWTMEEYQRRFGYIPFIRTEEPGIEEALRELLDPITRKAYGQLGNRHAQTYHSQAAGRALLRPIYEEAAWR